MAMYGADVAQLRTLAQQFDRQAQQLDAHRMTVGNAIQISAWRGPVAVRFRHQWDSDYSRRVHGAAQRLRTAAIDLRRNADEQDRASAAGGGLHLPMPKFGLVPIVLNDVSNKAWAGFEAFKSARDAVKHGVDLMSKVSPPVIQLLKEANWRFVTRDAQFLTDATRQAIGASTRTGTFLEDVGPGLKAAGKFLGVVGIGVGAVDTVMSLKKGDTLHAWTSGAQTVLGVAAMIPGPQQPFVAAAAVGVTVGVAIGDYVQGHPEIARSVEHAVSGATHAVSDASHAVVKAAEQTAKNVSGFLSSAGSFARSWFGR